MRRQTSDAVPIGSAVLRENEARDAVIEVIAAIVVKVRRPVGDSVKGGQIGNGRRLLLAANVR